MEPLAVQKRHLHNAKVPTVVYSVETRSGETRTFTLPHVEERTVPSSLELRDDAPADGDIHFRGHGAVFGRKSEDLGGFREIINPGAFKKVLDQNPDVRFMVNHHGLPLARTKNQTLDLREDPRGLHYYARAADTTIARDLQALVQRGDIDQSSFAFSMGPDSRERWEETEDGEIVRTIIEVDGLFDVSAVTYPAYPQADVTTHSAEPSTDTATAETEPEARTAEVAVDEEDAAAVQETQRQAALDELRDGAQRRLALAKAR